jgi:hypothetical protein
MRLINRRASLLHAFLIVLGATFLHQPSIGRAKTVVPVEFGDPIDNDEGPAKGPSKGATKVLSSPIQTNTAQPVSQRSRSRFLPIRDVYTLALFILRQWWR